MKSEDVSSAFSSSSFLLSDEHDDEGRRRQRGYLARVLAPAPAGCCSARLTDWASDGQKRGWETGREREGKKEGEIK